MATLLSRKTMGHPTVTTLARLAGLSSCQGWNDEPLRRAEISTPVVVRRVDNITMVKVVDSKNGSPQSRMMFNRIMVSIVVKNDNDTVPAPIVVKKDCQ